MVWFQVRCLAYETSSRRKHPLHFFEKALWVPYVFKRLVRENKVEGRFIKRYIYTVECDEGSVLSGPLGHLRANLDVNTDPFACGKYPLEEIDGTARPATQIQYSAGSQTATGCFLNEISGTRLPRMISREGRF